MKGITLNTGVLKIKTIYREAQRRMGLENIAALLAFPEVDILYLSGLHSHLADRLSLLIIPVEGKPTMLAPMLEESAYQDLSGEFQLRIWKETDNPYKYLREVLGVCTQPGDRVAVSATMHADVLLGIRKELHDREYISAKPLLSTMRMIKSPEEVEALREAGRRTDAALAALLSAGSLREMTERGLQSRVAMLLEKSGLQPDRPVFITSGPETAHIHHRAGQRKIAAGDALLVDLGGGYQRYISDMTRMVHIGEPDKEFLAVYKVVRDAQQAAIEAVRPGARCQSIDRAARNIIHEAGYGEFFIHRVGHGLGLEGHEAPYLVEGNEAELASDMIFTIEPGIYLPGKFGVRVEDMVRVTANGVERLTQSPRDLVVLE